MQKSAFPGTECVILLHGLGRTRHSLALLAKALQTHGYRTVNLDYASRRHDISALAEEVMPRSLKRCRAYHADKIHFVTHSLGGVLLRDYLRRHTIDELGNTVMLAPPNHGSEVADMLRGYAFYRLLIGPAGLQLGVGNDSVPARMGKAEFPLGIIAGNRCTMFDRYFASLLPAPNDGKVSVASAKLEGMRDFLEVPSSHTWIMNEPEVIAQIVYFLRTGQFEKRPAPAGKLMS